jgi:hypothetical protein
VSHPISLSLFHPSPPLLLPPSPLSPLVLLPCSIFPAPFLRPSVHPSLSSVPLLPIGYTIARACVSLYSSSRPLARAIVHTHASQRINGSSPSLPSSLLFLSLSLSLSVSLCLPLSPFLSLCLSVSLCHGRSLARSLARSITHSLSLSR